MNTSNNLSDSDCAGFYHWPPLWIGTAPVEQGADLTPALMDAEVFSSNLACGVRLKVSKQALFVFDFAQWEPGSAALAKGRVDNWEERVFARMRFMNLFLACLYTSMHRIACTFPPTRRAAYAISMSHDQRSSVLSGKCRFESETGPGMRAWNTA